MKRKKKKEEKTEVSVGYIPFITKRIWQAIRIELGRRWLFWLLVLISFPTLSLFMKASLSHPDGAGYFSYTRSLVMDRDLLFENDLKLLSAYPKNQ